MKKLFLTITILFSLLITANAQDVGKVWVGGSVGHSLTSIENGDSYLNFKILPEFGYVLSDKIGIGIKLGYQQTELDLNALLAGSERATLQTQGFTVNPFVRFSVLRGNLGRFFIDGGVGYACSKAKNSDIKTHAMEVGLRPGVSLNISEKIALTAKFGFFGYDYLEVGEGKLHSYGLDFDLDQALLGVSFVF